MSDYQEKLDIVDENDNIIGEDTRENVHKKGLLHREIHVWIYNDKGEILFQKRSHNKDTFPGLLDVSVGGHVERGETYEQAAVAELEEETGLKASKDDLYFIKKVRRKAFDESTRMTNNVFRMIYAYKYDGTQKLRLEKGKADNLEFWPFSKLLNPTEEDKKKFIPSLLSDEYIEIYQKLQTLL